jgi:hypothetical protein
MGTSQVGASPSIFPMLRRPRRRVKTDKATLSTTTRRRLKREYRSTNMDTERERPQDEDVNFQFPEREPAKEKAGFKRAATRRGTDDPRRSPHERKDVPQTPLAKRSRRGA